MTKEEIFEQMEVSAGTTDAELVIDPVTREISIPDTEKIFGVESDEKAERKYFKCPKIVGDNIDLSKLGIRVAYRNANGDYDEYICDDVKVNGEYVTFSWLLYRKVTKFKGKITFIVKAVKTLNNGTITNEWNTTLAYGTSLEGLEPGYIDVSPEQKDVIQQLLDLTKRTCEEAVNNVKKVVDQIKSERDSIEYQKKISEKIQTTLGKYFFGLKRGCYVVNSSNMIVECNDVDIINLRLTTGRIEKEYIPAGTKILCKETTVVRVWYCLDKNVIGYDNFSPRAIIKKDYNQKEYNSVYLDFKNSDNTSLSVDNDNIEIISENDGLIQKVNSLEFSVNPGTNNCWRMRELKNFYRFENNLETKFTSLVYTHIKYGAIYCPQKRIVYRKEVTDPLFEKCTWLIEFFRNVGSFAFGTRDIDKSPHACRVIVNPTTKTITVNDSDWNGNDTQKAKFNFDFEMKLGEKYCIEMEKTGSEKVSFKISCTTDFSKSFSFEFIEPIAGSTSGAKMRAFGAICFESIDAIVYIHDMTQKYLVDEKFDLLIIGDSFVDAGTYNIRTQDGYAYLCRKHMGNKCFASGHGGSTSTQLIKRLDSDANVGTYKYAIIQVGSNDSVLGINALDTFKNNLQKIIEYVISKKSIPILVTIPKRTDVDNTVFINEANEWIKNLGYQYIDEYDMVKGQYVLSDGIHPNKEGHMLIYQNIIGIIGS